jgi:hypothetical protein
MMKFIFFLPVLLTLCCKNLIGYELGVLTLFRDEAKFLKEWIEYHRMVGVDHFWLYNDRSVDNWEEVLHPYIESGLVEVIEWNKPPTVPLFPQWQIEAYQDGLKKARHNTKWLAFIDVDEFILPMQDKTVVDCLNNHYSDCSSVYVSWRNFGTSNVYLSPGDPILFRLNRCSLRAHSRNTSGKSIVRPHQVIIDKCWSPHFLVMHPTAVYMNGNRNQLYLEGSELKLDGKHCDKYIRINHYAMRDENFYQNVRLPKAISKEYGELHLLLEHYMSFNASRDNAMINFIKKHHPEMCINFWKEDTK